MLEQLRFKEADWNISGLFVHDNAILLFYDILEACGIHINMTVHGNIPCVWNSGRIIESVSVEYQQRCLHEYRKRNIGVLLTCSNYRITEENLDDGAANKILDLVAQNPRSGIICGSELLSNYVKNKYPNMFQCTSILRVVNEHGKGDFDYYSRLTDEYDRVVLHPDDGFNSVLLSMFPNKNKIEILINENCIRECTYREQHCNIVSEYYASERDYEIFKKMNSFKKTNCKSLQDVSSLNKYLLGECRTCNFSIPEVQRLYQNGYKHFKIQGRSLSMYSLLYDMAKYILTDEVGAMVCKMIMDRLDSPTSKKDKQVLTTNYDAWEGL